MRPLSARFSTLICVLGGAGLALAGFVFDGFAQGRGGYTAADAREGNVIYNRTCAGCHGEKLEGSGDAPALTGEAFLSQWRSQKLSDLSAHILQTMPPNKPRSLGSEDTRSVVAFILQRNGAPLRAQVPIGAATMQIGALLTGAGGAAVVRDLRSDLDPATLTRFDALRAPLDRLTPVTGAMLRDPSPNDWLMWRRTYNAWGYSPLKQINRDNVKNLTVAWTWGMDSAGMTEFTPIVHDGVMFLWNYGEKIEALDAKNGNLLWRYQHDMPEDYARAVFYRTKRALAIGGNKLIFPTTDMHIVALDVKTGKVLWDVVTDDYRKSNRVYNGGP